MGCMEASAQPLTAPRTERTKQTVQAGPLAGLVVQLLLLAALAATVGLGAAGWVVGLTCAVIIDAVLAYGLSRYGSERLRAADWVTLARASLAVCVAGFVADSFVQRAPVSLLVVITALALALDFVDGWVARRTLTTAAVGAQFDGEVDAFLLLVLSVYVARSAGVWVLAIGAARYAFLAAGWVLPWLREPLPPRYWRKFVAATQGIMLTVAAADLLPRAVAQALLVGALVLLAESFGRDVGWLLGHRRLGGGLTPGVAAPALQQGRVRTMIAATLTVLAVLIVWAALVAPNQPQDVTLTAFFRIPLEGLVLIALAAVLPRIPRRILAGLAGPALALLVVLKILDIAFFTSFARPFDIIGDAGDAGIGIETLRDALGRSEANLIIYGGVALTVVLVVVITLSTFRLTRVAASNRRWSLGAAGALGSVWLLCSAFGAQFLSHAPVASTSTASYVVHEVHTVQADIRDETVFANQIRHDPFRNTPGNQLLTGLRGKDVLLVFVESYGQVSVQGSSFSPAIDSLLTKGTKQLQTAGFSARSAFVNAPGFGGISWLAHSTLQSGVWANTQQRYNELVSSDRFTLSDAFNRAGWRTINVAPADDDHWTDGSSYYHYAKLYDRRNVGYRGPTYNYAPMPDQYMFAALQRLELAKAHRQPLFAEVDTVSSHMPWDRIPQMIPWNKVGNGSIFNHTRTLTEPNSFWWHPNQVKAAYARSLEYSLNTLISFVRHYGSKKLVLVVVGDEQPLAIVSGQHVSHDVPISVIARDPSVLKRIGRVGLGVRPPAPPEGAGLADERLPRPLPHRVRPAAGEAVALVNGSGGHRLGGLDGLRGLAALYVVINHVFLRTFPGSPVDHAPFWAGWFIYGRFAVVVFIVLSGFSLALSPARHGWRLDAISRYARRRALRILPAYWAALAFSLALAWLVVPQPGYGVPDAKSVVVNGLLVQNIIGARSPNAAFWSMAVEAQLYLLFPLLLLIIRRRGAVLMVAGVTLVVATVGIVGPHVSRLHNFVIHSPPDLAALFAVGVLSAGIVGASRGRRSWPWEWLALAAAVPVFATIGWQGSVWTLDHLLWVDLALGPAIACLLAALATGRPARLLRLLDARPIHNLGLSSYSLYLTHAPILIVVYELIVAGHVRQGVPAFLVTLALVLPLTIAFARVFASVFETPFTQRQGPVWAARPRRARAAGAPG